ncbi:MAG: YifB family Mg chelatase-like AAA ATPase [Treponema sp.]|nr:YifB family Mg chelatase-like AAA ATPase [Treponema sp.]
MQIYSFSPFGYEGSLVTVEVDLRRGIPAVDLVGLADSAVKEARERMIAAIKNCGFDFPPERVLISLSPADLKKEGAGFDLPLALGVLTASAENSEVPVDFLDDNVLIMGELELSGRIRAVKGVHAAAATASACGIMRCIVPAVNAAEAREVSGMKVYGATSLEDAFLALKDDKYFTERKGLCEDEEFGSGTVKIGDVYFDKVGEGFEYADVKGQKKLIRGLQIAAAGGHNFLAVGAPGCGKTMTIQKFPALLPLLSNEEAQSVTRIWSLAGILPGNQSLMRKSPFRMPHCTSSLEGMCGGGVGCKPGEISLAHNGVLFLDEAAEFRTTVLQTLRVPLESGSITLSRAGRSTVYPARFQLMMASNPCPCGNYGSDSKICLCSAGAVDKYWKKFSSPLMDRIDLRVSVKNEVDSEEGMDMESGLSTADLRIPIAKAVEIQRKRQAKKNAHLRPEEIEANCPKSDGARLYQETAAVRLGFSPRAIASCTKVARTIADMEGSTIIEEKHMEEAVSFRMDPMEMC